MSAQPPLDHEQLIQRIRRDLARQLGRRNRDGRRGLPSAARTAGRRRQWRGREGLSPQLLPAVVPPAGRAGEAAGLGVRHQTESGHPVRRPRRRRQGRRHQAHHAEAQSARLPRGRPARAQRSRAHAMVFPALRLASAGGRRNRAVRSQLVQPRRRRTRDGFLHATRSTKSSIARCRSSNACWCAPESACSSTGSRSPTKSSTCDSWGASTIRSSSGSSRRWIWNRAGAGRTTPSAKEVMLERSHIPEARWWVVQAVDKKRARLNCIDHLLKQFPYAEVPKQSRGAAGARAPRALFAAGGAGGDAGARDLLMGSDPIC